MRKLPILIASLILPGIGHVVRGRIAVGVAFFLGVVVVTNVYAWAAFRVMPPAPEWQRDLLVGGLCLLWAGCQAHLLWLLYIANPARHAARREEAFREGLEHYVRNELADAIGRFDEALRIERFDCDAWFHLGVCHSRAGGYRRAVRCFKKCTEFDDERKWGEEVAQEMRKAQAARKKKPQPDNAKEE